MWDKLQHEMYWNLDDLQVLNSDTTDKLQHEMYWNDLKI